MDRFKQPVQGKQYPSEYDLPSDMLADLLARDVATVVVQTLNLAVAGQFVLTTPGRGFVPYFWATNSTNKQRVASGLINVYIGTDAPTGFEDSFPAKHNRGFRGTFSKLYLSWAAQANTSVDFIIHRSKRTPWMSDDADISSAGFVTAVTGSGNIASSGGPTPNISFTGVLPVANGGTGQGAFTQGSVIFATTGGTLFQDNPNFFWDDTNNRLGIGTNAPVTNLHMVGVFAALQAPVTNGAVYLQYITLAGVERGYIGWGGSSSTTMNIQNSENGKIIFGTNAIDHMTLDALGRLGIGTTSPTANLHIGNGTGFPFAKISGGATSSGDGAYLEIDAGAGTFYFGSRSSIVGSTNFAELAISNYAAGGTINFDIGGTTRLIITNSGVVGIGRTPLAGQLEVFGGNPYINVVSSGANDLAGIRAHNGVNDTWFAVESTAGNLFSGTVLNATVVGNGNAFPLQFATGGFVRHNIQADGTHRLVALAGSTVPINAASTMGFYQTGTKYVLWYNDAGTIRYKYLDMSGTGVTWVHTTTAP